MKLRERLRASPGYATPVGPHVLQTANRLRLAFGLPAKPKRCCRKPGNMGAMESYEGNTKLGYQRCQVCAARHFTAILDPGEFGLRG